MKFLLILLVINVAGCVEPYPAKIEHSVDYYQLPQTVRDAFESNHSQTEVLSARAYEFKGRVIDYRIEFSDQHGDQFESLISAEGDELDLMPKNSP